MSAIRHLVGRSTDVGRLKGQRGKPVMSGIRDKELLALTGLEGCCWLRGANNLSPLRLPGEPGGC